MSYQYRQLLIAADKAETVKDYEKAIHYLTQALEKGVGQSGLCTKRMCRDRIQELKEILKEKIKC